MALRLVQRVAPALVALSVAIGFLPRLALCVGPGGHHAIELLNAVCCHELPGSATAARGQHSDGGCPQQCTDTPLGSGPVLIASDSAHRHNTGLPLLPAPVVTPYFARWCAVDFLAAPLAPAEHPPGFLRTTVILC